jgi:hypothetical protein
MDSDLARKGKRESITSLDRRKLALARQRYGRDKAAALRGLGPWCLANDRTYSERLLLEQIIFRSKVEQPYEWRDHYGPGEMARFFGMAPRSMRRAVADLKRDGMLRVAPVKDKQRIYRLHPDLVEALLGYGRWR